jgi:beta-glucosidase
MKKFNIDFWLAPGLNIHRNILCGRNFEYFSEDPLVSGTMAAAIVQGVQSVKNKAATIKHFAANNQEFNRLNSNSKISERALREIYLKGFKIAIEKGKPLGLMTSYNLLNGIHTSENFDLIINVLRNEWKYQGLIMTDWSTSGRKQFLKSKNPAQDAFNIIKAGVDIMMPGSKTDYDLLAKRLEEKILNREDLLRCAGKVYEIIKLIKGDLLD